MLLRILPYLLGILLPTLIAAASGQNEPGRFHFTTDQSKAEIPFYTFNNQVIIPVVVNNKVPLNFILDSGTSQAIFFDRKLAQDLGIGFGRKIQFSGVGNSHQVTAFRARGVSLGLPGIEGHMMGMAILNTDRLGMKRFDIHGIIGYQLFARFAIKIDYQRQVLTLMEPTEYNDQGYQTLPVEIENSKPYINSLVCLDNNREIPVRLMIDTGGTFGFSLFRGIHPQIQPPKKANKIRVGNGLGGEIFGYNGTAVLKLGNKLSTESETIYINKKEFSRKGQDAHKQGSIGNKWLRHFVVIFDYANSRLLVQPQDQSAMTKNCHEL